MRFRDKNGPLHHPILKPANLPDFLTVARIPGGMRIISELYKAAVLSGDVFVRALEA